MTTERDVMRELEAALDVTPSPDFEARVRERVRRQSFAVPRWTWPAGAAVAATLVFSVMLVPEQRVGRTDTTGRVNAPVTVVETPAMSVPPRRHQATASERPASPAGVRLAVRSGASRVSANVVVPAGQLAAIQWLAAEAAAGRIILSGERVGPQAALQVSALEAAQPIAFDTIRFTPLSADDSPELWR